MLNAVFKLNPDLDTRQIVNQIDTIVPELLALRRRLIAATPPPTVVTGSLTDALYGALGQGSWDEYDPDLDWARFGAL